MKPEAGTSDYIYNGGTIYLYIYNGGAIYLYIYIYIYIYMYMKPEAGTSGDAARVLAEEIFDGC